MHSIIEADLLEIDLQLRQPIFNKFLRCETGLGARKRRPNPKTHRRTERTTRKVGLLEFNDTDAGTVSNDHIYGASRKNLGNESESGLLVHQLTA